MKGFEKEQLAGAKAPKMRSEQSKTLSYSTSITSSSVDGDFVEGVEISESESSGIFSGHCIHIPIQFARAVEQDTMKAPSRPPPAPPRTTAPPQRCSIGVTEVPRCAEVAATTDFQQPAEGAATTAVQRLLEDEERVRQSLRYEQQVICAKRYATFGHFLQKLYCRLFQPSFNFGADKHAAERTGGAMAALIEAAAQFKQGNAKEGHHKIHRRTRTKRLSTEVGWRSWRPPWNIP